MTTVANFAQLSDVSVDLQFSGALPIDLTLEQNISDVPVAGEGSLLTWNVRREGTGNVTYEIRVNNVTSGTYTVTLSDWHAVQESMPTGRIMQGDNEVEFQVTGGTGILSIGDVMLWYRKDA